MSKDFVDFRCKGKGRKPGVPACNQLLAVIDAQIVNIPVEQQYGLQIKCKCGHMNVMWLGKKEAQKNPATVT